eukprot:s522_g13.t2
MLVTHLVALATIAIVDGTRAGLPAQGCSCCTGGILSCQQRKRGESCWCQEHPVSQFLEEHLKRNQARQNERILSFMASLQEEQLAKTKEFSKTLLQDEEAEATEKRIAETSCQKWRHGGPQAALPGRDRFQWMGKRRICRKGIYRGALCRLGGPRGGAEVPPPGGSQLECQDLLGSHAGLLGSPAWECRGAGSPGRGWSGPGFAQQPWRNPDPHGRNRRPRGRAARPHQGRCRPQRQGQVGRHAGRLGCQKEPSRGSEDDPRGWRQTQQTLRFAANGALASSASALGAAEWLGINKDLCSSYYGTKC